MADTIGIKLGVEGEKEFKQALADINQNMKVLGSEMKLAASEFDKNEKSVGSLTARNDVLNKQIDEQKNKISTLEQALKNASDSFGENDKRTQSWQVQLNNAKAALNDMERELSDNEQAIDNMSGEMSDAEKQTDDFSEAVKDSGKAAENAKSGFEKAGAVIKKIGAAITIAAAAIDTAVVSFSKSSVEVGMSFDNSMSQVAATMGTTVDQIQDLRDFAQEMGSKTAFSATQAADALNYMALAGYDADTSMKMLPNVLNLAAAGGMELASASDMITDSQSALGLSLEETSELVDKMAKASSKSNTSVSQLGEAILTIGGTAKSLSGGTTELSTALGILADNGVKGAEGGTALRNIILSLSAPTNKAAKALKNLGVEVYDAEGNMRPLNETFGDLNAALSSMTQGEQTQVLNTIFNKVDLKSVNALLANTIGSFEDIEGAIKNTGVNWGKYDVSAETALQNAAYMLESLGLSAEEAQKQLSLEMNIDAEDALATVNVAWKALDEGAATTMTRFDELSGYINDATGAAQAMADTQLDNLAGDITIFQSALEGAKITLSDELTPTLRQFVQFGSEGISKITEGFKDGGLDGAMSAFGTVLSDVIAMITEMLPDIVTAGSQVLTAFVDGITQNIEPITEAAFSIAMTLFNAISENTPRLLGAGITVIQTMMNGISENIGSITGTIVQLVVSIAQILTSPDTLIPLLDAALQLIIGLAEGIIQAIPALIEALPAIITAIVEFIVGAIPQIIEAGVQLLTSLVSAMPDIITAIVEAIPQIIDGIVSAFTENIDLIIQAGLDLFVALIQALPDIITTIVGAVPQIIESIVNGISGNLDKIIMAGVQLFVSLIANLPKIIIEIAKAVPQIIAGIVEAFGNSLYRMVEIGGNLVKGLWEGISGAAAWLWDKISGWIGGIWDGICGFFGIHSPSTEMAWVGKMLIDGLAGSINANGKKAVTAAVDMADDINGVMNGLSADMRTTIPSSIDISTTLTGAEGLGQSSNTQAFDVTIPLTIDGTTLARILAEVQWSQNAVYVRNLGMA